jgi:hypothetical protein
MTPTDILHAMRADGLIVELNGDRIRLAGSPDAVSRWKDTVASHKPEIVSALKSDHYGDGHHVLTPADTRLERAIGRLNRDGTLRYAIESHLDVEPGTVILSVAIRGKGACELRIPSDRYDPFLLMNLIDKHTATGVMH